MKKKLLILILLSIISCSKKNKVVAQQNNGANIKLSNTGLVANNNIVASSTHTSNYNLTFNLIPNQSTFVNEARKVSFTIQNAGENFNCETSLKASTSDPNLVPVSNIIFSGKNHSCFAEIKPLPEKSGLTTLTFEFLQNDNSSSKMTFIFEVSQKISKTDAASLEKQQPNSHRRQDVENFIHTDTAPKDTQEVLPISNILSSAKNEQPVFKNIEQKPGDPKPSTQDGIKNFLHSAEDLKK